MYNKISKKISIFSIIVILCIIFFLYSIYKKYNINDFSKGELNPHISQFLRDDKIKLNKIPSFKIVSEDFNDAIIFKEIDVKPYTAYKVSLKVKTENVISENGLSSVGAHISVQGTSLKSESISGTTDWTTICMYFNSQNNTKMNIGFRLGGYEGKCKGTAWFDDIIFEEGATDTTNNWKFACFIFKNTDVTLDNKQIKIEMSDEDISNITKCMYRFSESISDFSMGKIEASYDLFEIETPITRLSYEEQDGYFIRPEDVSDILVKYIKKNEYDYIYVVVKLGDLSKNIEIPVNDWIGLGGMDYMGLGFSNIRVPNNEESFTYKYVSNIHEFPEEVFVHEFLHTLERTASENDLERPNLHDYEKYGYTDDRVIGLKTWYIDYMNKNIKDGNGKLIGLDEKVYSIKTVNESDFEFSIKKDIVNEPKNIIEKIRAVVKNIFKGYNFIKQQIHE